MKAHKGMKRERITCSLLFFPQGEFSTRLVTHFVKERLNALMQNESNNFSSKPGRLAGGGKIRAVSRFH
jgi:hypothetical protein